MKGEEYRCPTPEELTRAYFEGSFEGLDAHLISCENCAREWRELDTIVELGEKLPYEPPSSDQVDKVLIGLYAKASKTEKSKYLDHKWAIGAVATVAITLLTAILFATIWTGSNKHKNQSPVFRGTITAKGQAQYVVESGQPDEVLRLIDGEISIDVAPLKSGEKFHVVVGDAKVLVLGTVFSVMARNNELIDVEVHHGSVEIYKPAKEPVILELNQRWSQHTAVVAMVNTEPVKTEPMQVALVTRESFSPVVRQKSESIPSPSISPSESEAQSAVREGIRLLKTGSYSAAAKTFENALGKGEGPLQEEAAYWSGVAYKYAGRPDKAMGALRYFISSFPSSSRKGEASVMLGWLSLDKGNVVEARSLFEFGKKDGVAKVRLSAQKGLAIIKSRSHD